MCDWYFDEIEGGIQVIKEENGKALMLGIDPTVQSALAVSKFFEEHDIIHLKGLRDRFICFENDGDYCMEFVVNWNNLMFIKPVGAMRS